MQALALTEAGGARALRAAGWLAGVLVAVAACYAPAWSGPYQFDDRIGVAVDPAAASLAAWRQDAAAHVRPLLKASFALSHGLGEAIGHVPAGHRLVNLAIHLATVALMFALGRQLAHAAMPRLPARTAAIAAALGAALFGLHPLATEAVSYVSGRSMSLGTLLACASLACWARGRSGKSPAWHAAALLLAVLAALCRETVVFTLLLLVPAWELLRPDRAKQGRARTVLTSAAIFVAIAVATLLWMRFGHERYAALLRLSWWIGQVHARDASLLAALQYFAAATVLLRPPSIDPDVSASLSLAARLGAAAGVGAALAAAWAVRTRHPQWLIAAVWVLAWLAPLYAVALRHDAVSERHFYPALWGPSWALAVSLAAPMRQARPAIPALVLAALLALSASTVSRNLDYRSEIALWEATLRSDPHKLRVLNNLGVVYMEAGRWDEARQVLERAQAQDPQDPDVRWNLAAARLRDLAVLSLPALPP